MLEWNLENQAEWLIFISPIFFQVILIWSILLLKTAEQYASHMLLEASLPVGDTGAIELEPFLRSEVLKASHFLVFLSVPTPDSLWPAQFFFHLSDSEERLHSFSVLLLKSSHHVHFMILMGITREALLMPVPSAISLVSLTPQWHLECDPPHHTLLPTMDHNAWPHCFSCEEWLQVRESPPLTIAGFGGRKLGDFAHQFRFKRSGECPKRGGLCCWLMRGPCLRYQRFGSRFDILLCKYKRLTLCIFLSIEDSSSIYTKLKRRIYSKSKLLLLWLPLLPQHYYITGI